MAESIPALLFPGTAGPRGRAGVGARTRTSNPRDNERGQATGAKDTDRGVEEVAVEGGPYDETVDVNEALEAAAAEGRAEGGADDRA